MAEVSDFRLNGLCSTEHLRLCEDFDFKVHLQAERKYENRLPWAVTDPGWNLLYLRITCVWAI
jgi:hypothetical protein